MVEKGQGKSTRRKRKTGRKSPRPTPKNDRQYRADDNLNPSPLVKANNDTSLAKRTDFLRCLYNGMTPTRACQTVQISRSWVYGLRERDPSFAKLWEKALDEGHTLRMETLEGIMQDGAVNGFVEEVTEYAIVEDQGQQVEVPVKRVVRRKQDPRSILALLEVGDPEKWKPPSNVQTTVGLNDGLADMIKRVQSSETTGLDSLVKD